MLRIIVIGITGSGKTTFARALARRLDFPHGEQDAWNHEADWQMAPLERFRACVDAFTFGPACRYPAVLVLAHPLAQTARNTEASGPVSAVDAGAAAFAA